MSLSVYLKDPTSTYKTDELYYANITHNLWKMAREAGIYEALWRPHRLREDYNIPAEDSEAEQKLEESSQIIASDIIEIVEEGLTKLKARPKHYQKFDNPNGWGLYKYFVPFVERYLEALKKYPLSIVEVDR